MTSPDPSLMPKFERVSAPTATQSLAANTRTKLLIPADPSYSEFPSPRWDKAANVLRSASLMELLDIDLSLTFSGGAFFSATVLGVPLQLAGVASVKVEFDLGGTIGSAFGDERLLGGSSAPKRITYAFPNRYSAQTWLDNGASIYVTTSAGMDVSAPSLVLRRMR